MDDININNMLKGDRDALALKMLGAKVTKTGYIYMAVYGNRCTIFNSNGTVLKDKEVVGSVDDYYNYMRVYIESYIGFIVYSDFDTLESCVIKDNGEVIASSKELKGNIADIYFADYLPGYISSPLKQYIIYSDNEMWMLMLDYNKGEIIDAVKFEDKILDDYLLARIERKRERDIKYDYIKVYSIIVRYNIDGIDKALIINTTSNRRYQYWQLEISDNKKIPNKYFEFRWDEKDGGLVER